MKGAVTSSLPVGADRRPVPVRTILATIGLVLATALLIYMVLQVRQVLTWIVVAAFFAVALYPLVGWVQRRLLGGKRRALATFLVFLLVFVVLAALIAAFAVPLVDEGTKLAGQLPQQIADARSGRGPIGDLLQRTNALQWVQDNQDKISNFASGLTAPAASVASGFATGIAGTLTVFVLAYLMVLEGPKVVDGSLNVFRPATGERIRRVGADCAKSVTGYISGNLLISFICGLLTYIVLLIWACPSPDSSRCSSASPTSCRSSAPRSAARWRSSPGFSTPSRPASRSLVFFVLYQQLENHLLQPLVFARTVQLNPLTVIIAILVGVELLGILGALLAIPVASMIQVILRDLWDHRRGRPKEEPTVGADREPALAEDQGAAGAPAALDRTNGSASLGADVPARGTADGR